MSHKNRYRQNGDYPEMIVCNEFPNEEHRRQTPPDFVLWHVFPHPNFRPREWVRVGGVWRHADGRGYTAISTVAPWDVTFILRDPDDHRPEYEPGPERDPLAFFGQKRDH